MIEVIPPSVNTDLGGVGLHTHGVPVAVFADTVMKGLERGDREIAYGFSERAACTFRSSQKDRRHDARGPAFHQNARGAAGG